jgi:hypothetical protein
MKLIKQDEFFYFLFRKNFLQNKKFFLKLNLKAEKMVGGYINGVYKQTLCQTKKGGDKK